MRLHPTIPRDLLLVFCLCAISFSFGFFGYLAIELLYKSFISHSPTHWSMGLVAGLSFLFLLTIDQKKMPLLAKAFLGGVFITLLEFLAGMILNLHFRLAVWDYSDSFWNIKGQICPAFSLVWFALSFVIIAANRALCRILFYPFHEKNHFRN